METILSIAGGLVCVILLEGCIALGYAIYTEIIKKG